MCSNCFGANFLHSSSLTAETHAVVISRCAPVTSRADRHRAIHPAEAAQCSVRKVRKLVLLGGQGGSSRAESRWWCRRGSSHLSNHTNRLRRTYGGVWRMS